MGCGQAPGFDGLSICAVCESAIQEIQRLRSGLRIIACEGRGIAGLGHSDVARITLYPEKAKTMSENLTGLDDKMTVPGRVTSIREEHAQQNVSASPGNIGAELGKAPFGHWVNVEGQVFPHFQGQS